jgi:nucleotide-binding universal stress UspA family protein
MVDRGPQCIGVAIDPVKPCEPALRYASFLAAWHGAELVLLTAGPVEGAAADALGEAAGRLAELAAGLEPEPGWRAGATAYRLRPFGGGPGRRQPRTTEMPARSPVAEALRAAARSQDVDLLVVPRGVCWSGALYPLESIAERLALGSSVPVLAVPETGSPAVVGPRPTIVVPALSAESAPACLRWAFSFSDRLEGRVAVVPAGGDAAAALVRLRRALGRIRTDLVVTTAEERDAAGARRLSHVVAGLLRTAPCPVLVLPPRRRAAMPEPGDDGTCPPPRRPRSTGAGSSPTSVRWHLRTCRVERRPTDGWMAGR